MKRTSVLNHLDPIVFLGLLIRCVSRHRRMVRLGLDKFCSKKGEVVGLLICAPRGDVKRIRRRIRGKQKGARWFSNPDQEMSFM